MRSRFLLQRPSFKKFPIFFPDVMKTAPIVHCIPDKATSTCQYVVSCRDTKKAVVIDSVLDFDFDSGVFSKENVEKIAKYVKDNDLQVEWVLDTHVHADHVSACHELRSQVFPGAKTGIGCGVAKVQETFKPIYNLEKLKTDGSQWDRLFDDGDELQVGSTIHVKVLHTPGHTADSCSFYLRDCGIFVGDTIFFPDKGSARCDFPNGSAELLYKSIQKLLSFPDDTKLFLCHDYPGLDRAFVNETTVGETKANNIHLKLGVSFVEMRKARDETLKIPHLLIPSVQLNLECGKLPEPESNGRSYIKIPLNTFSKK